MDEIKEKAVAKLLKRLNTDDAELVGELYDESLAKVLDYTNRTALIGNMATYVKQLTVIAFNRQGAEGESSRTEGGIKADFEVGIPTEIKQGLKRYRLAKVVPF